MSKIKGLNAGLGYTGSDGHDLYSLADWGDRVFVIGEFWEEGKPADGQMYYYSSDERAKLAKQFKATKRGQKLIFGRWEKKALTWDHCGILAMVRKGGPVGICWFPKEYRPSPRVRTR